MALLPADETAVMMSDRIVPSISDRKKLPDMMADTDACGDSVVDLTDAVFFVAASKVWGASVAVFVMPTVRAVVSAVMGASAELLAVTTARETVSAVTGESAAAREPMNALVTTSATCGASAVVITVPAVKAMDSDV